MMKCRYCKKPVRPVGDDLVSGSQDRTCEVNPQKKHAILPDGVHCIYCGRTVKKLGIRLVTSLGQNCPASPSYRHSLG